MTQVQAGEQPTVAGAGDAYKWRWLVLGVLLVAEAMNLLDATIVQVAAPVIHAELGGRASDIQWFSAAYTLPFAALLITGGRLGDIAGRKRVFRIGVAGFLVTSVCCALAPDPGVLIAARALQGAAAALVIPQTIGLIRAMFDADELPKALGSIGPVMGLAGICGPLLGGLLTHADLFGSSWRPVFAVNLPLGLVVLLATPLMREDRSARRPQLDLTGSALLVAGSALAIDPLIQGENWICLPIGLVVLAVCFLQQRSRRHGRAILVETSLFENRGFAPALLTSTLFFAMTTGVTLVVVLQLQLGLHFDVLRTSLTLLPWSAASGVASWFAGAVLVPRYGSKTMFAGIVAILAGLLGTVAAYNNSRTDWPLYVPLGVCGLGVGLFATPFFTTALHRVRPHETGSAAGLLNAVQQFGGTVGIALLGTIFLHTLRSRTPASAAEIALAVAIALTLATAASAAFMNPRTPNSSSTPPAVDQTRPAKGFVRLLRRGR
ncbi:MFS transporter [Kribbella monticola]|uniref:MFS transporter n=1 Tax=Kribbella monticola TaxID=2185285 RepID=UPI000DD38E85|nr:MFS transporter [Kribbella monticola]